MELIRFHYTSKIAIQTIRIEEPLNEKIGKYSGNRRADTSKLQEPDDDNEEEVKNYLTGNTKTRLESVPRRAASKLRYWKRRVPKNIQIHMVGESHIDVAWMWRYEQTRKKAQVTFRKAILHSKLFPDFFCFALSEPILLDWIKEDDKELFKEIQETVKKGNIELVGGAYVEPDCMMPSGESFVRQRLYGMRFYRDNFGILPKVEWFLDSFGYNYGLPQILAKSGVKYFWTTKITWNLQTTFPFVHFWWQGPDGTQLLTANFGMGAENLTSWKKFDLGHHLLKEGGKKVWDYSMDYRELIDHVEDDVIPQVGFFFGKGDGGHGPTHQEMAYALEWAKVDMFKWSRVLSFYEEIEKASDRFPVWNDELYLENHRGCFSNHAEVKRQNRKYEYIIPSLESLSVIAALSNPSYNYPVKQLEKLWKTTLKNQFHDVLPGTSIPEVYDDCWDDWEQQELLIEDIKNDIGKTLSSQENANEDNVAYVFLYNSLSWDRESRIFIPINIFKNDIELDEDRRPLYAKLEFLNGEREIFICQPFAEEPENTIDRMPAGWWAVLKINSLTCEPVRIKLLNKSESEEITKQTVIKSTKYSIGNGKTSVELDPKTGAILKITSEDVNSNNNLLTGTNSNLTLGFLDESRLWPAWNLHDKYWEHPISLSNEESVTINVSEVGPVFTTIEIVRTLGVSCVIQKISLFSNCSELFLEYLTDWKQQNIMLKVLYSTTTKAEIVTADESYCAIEAKTNPEVPNDVSRYEKICHKYFDLSTPDNEWGIALLNEGKYAFDVKGGDMKLTMLRACLYPDPAPEAWVNAERKENEEKYNHKVPQYSGLGPFKCRYALLPHTGGALKKNDGTPNPIVKRKAEEFNAPILIIPTSPIQEDTSKILGVPVEILTPNVYLGVLKLNEWDSDGSIILRVVEGSGVPTLAKIKFNLELTNKISGIKAVDLLEREIEVDFTWNSNSKILSFQMGTFEIITFKIII